MKKLIASIIMLALIYSGAAYASEYIYTVKKGNCLIRIGKKLNADWNKIALDNNIKPPSYTIYPNQKLVINCEPEKIKNTEVKSETSDLAAKRVLKREKINTINIGREKATASVAEESQIKEYNRDDVGTDMFTGTKEKAIMLLGFPAGSILKYDGGAPDKGRDNLKKGDEVWMTHGKNKVDHYKVNLDTPERSLRYQVLDKDGNFLGYAYWMFACFNWYRKIELAPAPASMEKPEMAPITPFGVPGEIKKPMEVPRAKWDLEHEPIIGVYYWENKLAEGWGGYGEDVEWFRRSFGTRGYWENGWAPGVGVYGYYSEGQSFNGSAYEWVEKGFGPQLGIKYLGQDAEGRFWQWQLKARFVWEGGIRRPRFTFRERFRYASEWSPFCRQSNVRKRKPSP
ncbi:MAG: LysM peptidoglycan-binding domain-containing protein, partial [Candidatus Moranbacteria bacterium]|nr:LysM peptidoglycan-binding domain-containing protein [Candidatus Moranbacteria bacterium]